MSSKVIKNHELPEKPKTSLEALDNNSSCDVLGFWVSYNFDNF